MIVCKELFFPQNPTFSKISRVFSSFEKKIIFIVIYLKYIGKDIIDGQMRFVNISRESNDF